MFRRKVSTLSEIRAVDTAFLRSADFVDHRKLEGTIAIGSRVQARRIDVVTETDVELLVVKTSTQDDCVHQFAIVEAVGQTGPRTKLECLVVAAAVAEQEFEGVTHIYLPGWALEESNNARNEAEFAAVHELTSCMEGEFGVERNVLFFKRLVGAVEVTECSTEVEIVVVAQYAEPQSACRQVDEQETRVVNYIRRKGRIEYAIAVVLLWPLQVSAVDAAVAEAYVGAKYQVVGFFAVSTHFFGVGTRQTSLNSSEFRSTRFIAPQRTADSEVVVTAYWQFLVIRYGVGIVGIFLEDRSPLVAVVGNQAVVTVHHTGERRVQVEGALVELREVNVLCRCRDSSQQDGAANRKV